MMPVQYFIDKPSTPSTQRDVIEKPTVKLRSELQLSDLQSRPSFESTKTVARKSTADSGYGSIHRVNYYSPASPSSTISMRTPLPTIFENRQRHSSQKQIIYADSLSESHNIEIEALASIINSFDKETKSMIYGKATPTSKNKTILEGATSTIKNYESLMHALNLKQSSNQENDEFIISKKSNYFTLTFKKSDDISESEKIETQENFLTLFNNLCNQRKLETDKFIKRSYPEAEHEQLLKDASQEYKTIMSSFKENIQFMFSLRDDNQKQIFSGSDFHKLLKSFEYQLSTAASTSHCIKTALKMSEENKVPDTAILRFIENESGIEEPIWVSPEDLIAKNIDQKYTDNRNSYMSVQATIKPYIPLNSGHEEILAEIMPNEPPHFCEDAVVSKKNIDEIINQFTNKIGFLKIDKKRSKNPKKLTQIYKTEDKKENPIFKTYKKIKSILKSIIRKTSRTNSIKNKKITVLHRDDKE